MSELEKLQLAIATLEAQRAVLGDDVVEAALGPMREKLVELEAQSAPEPQRKQVTVLFMDIVDSTRISQGLDPEEILEIMDGALKRMALPVEEHGGYVTRSAGDGFMAIFGIPVARENDARQAVRSGLGILEVARACADELKRERQIRGFNVRIGINTGLVATGGFSETEDTVLGGLTVNLGARLESAAPPGGLLISHYTYRHIRGIFDLEPLEPIVAKGFTEPVPVYLVTREKPRAFRTFSRGVDGVETPMVGRQDELERLQDIYEKALKDPKTHIITIVGDPGVGKSRLLSEFENWIELQPERVRFIKGRASQPLKDVPYGLLRDLLAFRFSLQDSDPVAVVRQKLETGLVEFFEDEPQMKAHFICSLVGYDFSDSSHLLGVQSDSKQLRERGLFYLTQFFNTLAQQSPTIIFLEDIHWADGPSLDAITQLVNHCHRLMVICLARPVMFERYPEWGQELDAVETSYTRLELHSLSQNASRLLVGEIIRKGSPIPISLRDLIVSTTEGNPFYIEELIRMLIEDGVILKDAQVGTWRVDPTRLPHLRVPSTLIAVLQARLDTLSPADRVTLQQAAMVGRVFWDVLLQVLQGANHPPAPELASLSRRELIFPHVESVFAHTNEYVFKHTMLRDVAYESVLKRARKTYHKQVASWLVEVTQASGRIEEYTAVIAKHFELAGEKSAAADWYLHAGECAKAQGTPKEARNFFDRALELLSPTDQERRWRGLLGRNEVSGILGDFNARLADDDALLALAKEMEDDSRLAEAYSRKGYYYEITGDDRSALQAYDDALVAAKRAGVQRLEALVVSLKVASQTRLGEMSAAAATAQEALTLAQELGDETILAMALTNVSIFYMARGDIATGVQLLDQQVTINHQLGNRTGEAFGLANLGYNYVLLGLYKLGRNSLKESLRLTEAIGYRRESAYNRLNLGLAYLRDGDSRAARLVLEQSIPELVAIGDTFGQAASQSYLALSLEQSGEVVDAEKHFKESYEIFSQIGVRGYTNDALAGLARCLLAQGQLEAAHQHAKRVWDDLEGHGAGGMEFPILAYRTCADIFDALGDSENAFKAVEVGYRELMNRANRISNLEWRNSFLENVPEHRSMIEMWKRFPDKQKII